MKAPTASADFYEADAQRRGELYARVTFDEVHSAMLKFLPPPGAAVLDVGAGSGRDAAALADRGYSVTAVEPVPALLAWGQGRYAGTIEWIVDSLPDLTSLTSSRRRYDFILCSAVLMHVRPPDLRPSFVAMAALLASKAHLGLSVRGQIASDPPGLFHAISDADLVSAAAAAGLQLVDRSSSADRLGRTDVRWRSFIFQLSNAASQAIK